MPLRHTPLSSDHVFCTRRATTEIYTLSLHDALPICFRQVERGEDGDGGVAELVGQHRALAEPAEDEREVQLSGDRKSTRLNSSHVRTSYAVFCLKKKKKMTDSPYRNGRSRR